MLVRLGSAKYSKKDVFLGKFLLESEIMHEYIETQVARLALMLEFNPSFQLEYDIYRDFLTKGYK